MGDGRRMEPTSETTRAVTGMTSGWRSQRVVVTALLGLSIWLLARWWTRLQWLHALHDASLLLLWAAGLAAVFLAFRKGVSTPWRTPRHERGPPPTAALWVLWVVAVVFSLTTVVHFGRYYFLNWPVAPGPVGTLLRRTVLHFIVLSWLAAAALLRWDPRRWLVPLLATTLVAGQVLCGFVFLRTLGGQPIWSDDHPSFMFRMAEFWGSFPWRENYLPYWNAGLVNSVLVPSGSTGFALFMAPLWWVAEPHQVFSLAIALTYIVLVPWITTAALRSLGLGWSGALPGGILALCAGRLFFVWMLHFGTAGAALSWTMLPAATAFLYAVAIRRKTGGWVCAGLVLTMFFMAQWPPSMLLGLPLGLVTLLHARRWWPHRARWALFGCAAVLAVLLLHNLWVVLQGNRDLVGYTLAAPRGPRGLADVYQQFRKVVVPGSLETNPVAMVLGILGAWALPWRRLRRYVLTVFLVILLVATLGPVYAPQLQSERMAIAGGMLALVPAACWLRRLWAARTTAAVIPQATFLALLLMGVGNTARIYGSRGYAPFVPMLPGVHQVVDVVRNHVPEDGRLLFAGPTKHAYGRGHVAYLPLLTGREMMACDYYDFPPGRVELDYPPRAARTRPGGLHGFMALHGATHVVTHHARYIDHFRARPGQFRELLFVPSGFGSGYTFFEVLGAGRRFHRGSGTVHATFNRIRVRLEDPSQPEIVLAYNWHERLETAAPAELFPYDTGLGAVFVGVRPAGLGEIDIRYRNRF